MRAGWSVLWHSPSVLSSHFPQARYTTVVRFRAPTMSWTRKKCWSADALCRLDPGPTPQCGSEQDLGSPEALLPRLEESCEKDRPFLPRLLLQEIIFAHSPYGGVFHNGPSLQENLLCRSDWLCLRGIWETECMILSVRELAAFPRRSVCELLKAQECSQARRSPSAPTLLDGSRWQSDSLDRADSPCRSLETASLRGRRLMHTLTAEQSRKWPIWWQNCPQKRPMLLKSVRHSDQAGDSFCFYEDLGPR